MTSWPTATVTLWGSKKAPWPFFCSIPYWTKATCTLTVTVKDKRKKKKNTNSSPFCSLNLLSKLLAILKAGKCCPWICSKRIWTFWMCLYPDAPLTFFEEYFFTCPPWAVKRSFQPSCSAQLILIGGWTKWPREAHYDPDYSVIPWISFICCNFNT